MRWVISALVVLGLTVGIVLMWPSAEPNDPPVAEATTTSTIADSTTSTTAPVESTTSTTVDDGSHVVETAEEAEEILRELWFGWFEGIYNQDEDRIREVVATEHQFDLATEQFGQMEFQAAPEPTSIGYSGTELLHSSPECTVIWTTAQFTGFANAAASDVHVLRWKDGWRIFSLWANRGDLWEADCEAQLG